MAMRQKQRQTREKHVMENLKPTHPEFKLKQFENVKSRLHQSCSLPRLMPNGQSAVKRPNSRQEDNSRNEDCAAAEQVGDEEAEIDLASFEAECERLKQLHGKNQGGGKAQPEVRKFQKDAGGCPAYLQKIKAGLAEQERQAVEERTAPKVPAGYRQMPEDERLETLKALQTKREDLEKAFQRLPLTIETDTQKRRQKVVLDKIAESDKAIGTFSNPMVLIQA